MGVPAAAFTSAVTELCCSPLFLHQPHCWLHHHLSPMLSSSFCNIKKKLFQRAHQCKAMLQKQASSNIYRFTELNGCCASGLKSRAALTVWAPAFPLSHPNPARRDRREQSKVGKSSLEWVKWALLGTPSAIPSHHHPAPAHSRSTPIYLISRHQVCSC